MSATPIIRCHAVFHTVARTPPSRGETGCDEVFAQIVVWTPEATRGLQRRCHFDISDIPSLEILRGTEGSKRVVKVNVFRTTVKFDSSETLCFCHVPFEACKQSDFMRGLATAMFDLLASSNPDEWEISTVEAGAGYAKVEVKKLTVPSVQFYPLSTPQHSEGLFMYPWSPYMLGYFEVPWSCRKVEYDKDLRERWARERWARVRCVLRALTCFHQNMIEVRLRSMGNGNGDEGSASLSNKRTRLN